MMEKIKRGILSLAGLYVKTPFYPHWLEFMDVEKKNNVLLKALSEEIEKENKKNRRLLEIGCGNKVKKSILCNKLGIPSYYGLDFPAWVSNNFETSVEQVPFKSSFLGDVLFGKTNYKPDIWGDTHFLPFANESFDFICHFETMEHVANIDKAFSEVNRCLRNEGFLFFSIPFLYQEHTNYDISRLTRQGIDALCRKYGLVKIKCFETGFGTTLSQLCNSFLIKHMVGLYQGSKIRIIAGALIASFIFPVINVMCLIINQTWEDPAYANHFFFIFQKKSLDSNDI